MAGRYYLTGVQLGMLMELEDEEAKMKMLQDIMDNQFMGNIGDGTELNIDDLETQKSQNMKQ